MDSWTSLQENFLFALGQACYFKKHALHVHVPVYNTYMYLYSVRLYIRSYVYNIHLFNVY